jgi:hypothetical protein
VTDLDTALRDLAAHVAFPDPPDVAAAVRLRLTTGPPPVADASGRFAWTPRTRRLLAIAAAILVVVAVVAAAVPRARHAVADRLGLRGVEIRVVPTSVSSPAPGPTGVTTATAPAGVATTAPPPTASVADLGRPTTLAAAAAAFPGTLLVPPDPPTAVYVDDRTGEVNLTLAGGLLLGQFPNAQPLFEKVLDADAATVAVRVGGGRGLWLPGRAHLLILLGGEFEEPRARLAGPTLIWEHGDTTLRLEGASSLEAALAVAGSLRPFA